MRFECQTYHKYGEDDKYLIDIYNDDIKCFLDIKKIEGNFGVYTSLKNLTNKKWLDKHHIKWERENDSILPTGLIISSYIRDDLNSEEIDKEIEIIKKMNLTNNLGVWCNKEDILLFPKYLRMLKRLVKTEEDFESEIKEFQNLFNKGEK